MSISIEINGLVYPATSTAEAILANPTAVRDALNALLGSSAWQTDTNTTTASGITVTLSPAQYTPSNGTVEGHLTGLDAALEALQPRTPGEIVQAINDALGSSSWQVDTDTAAAVAVARTPDTYGAASADVEAHLEGIDAHFATFGTAAFGYQGGVDYLTKDTDQTIDVSQPGTYRDWRTGSGWSGGFTFTFEGAALSGGRLTVSNNSGHDQFLTGTSLDLPQDPFRLERGEYIDLVVDDNTQKLVKVRRGSEVSSSRSTPFGGLTGQWLGKLTGSDHDHDWLDVSDLAVISAVTSAEDLLLIYEASSGLMQQVKVDTLFDDGADRLRLTRAGEAQLIFPDTATGGGEMSIESDPISERFIFRIDGGWAGVLRGPADDAPSSEDLLTRRRGDYRYPQKTNLVSDMDEAYGGDGWRSGTSSGAPTPGEVNLQVDQSEGWIALNTSTDEFEPAADPTSGHGDNYTLLPANYTEHGSGGSLGGSTTIAGVEGRVYNRGASYGWIGFGRLNGGVPSGATLYVEALAVYPSGAAFSGGDAFCFTLQEIQSDNEYEIQALTDGTVAQIEGTPTAWGGRFGQPSTANDAYNKVIPLGQHPDGDAYLIQLAIPVLGAVSEDLMFCLTTEDDNSSPEVPVAGVYVGLDAVNAESSGDDGRFLLPGATGYSIVNLRAAAPHEPYQAVSLSSDADLILPTPPASGKPPRETRLRAELTGGAVLNLPSGSQVREMNSGTTGVLSASGFIHVEQRPDGSADLIVAEFN